MSPSNFSVGRPAYDFIFLGAGCAALSIVMRMIRSRKFTDKRILLIDKEPKTNNDRTWCFWETQDGFFEDVVYKKWDRLSFFGDDDYADTGGIAPYQYKMIRGIDFYNYCFGEIGKHANIELCFGVATMINAAGKKMIELNGEYFPLNRSIVFNSFINDTVKTNSEIFLFQHFKGWVIETPSPVFDPSVATFMDFRVDQKRGTTFAYVLPLTGTKALVEYTLFSKNILEDGEYEQELANYITDILCISNYRISEKEFGVIPMTTKKTDFFNGGVYSIGTVGGQTKASTGYTFQFIQKQSELIKEYLISNRALIQLPRAPKRFTFYDKVLLDVLQNKRAGGKEIFTTLFKKNKLSQVLKFLDNESSVGEELKIIASLPTLPFLKAAINQF
jgi:lycopene beta-cyclase